MRQPFRVLSVSIVFFAGVLLAIVAATPKSGGAEPDFKALIATVDAAWLTLKAENAAPYYAHDAGLVFYDAAPLKHDGWDAYRDGAQKLVLDGAKSMQFKGNDDMNVVRRGNIAWTTRTLHLSAPLPM